MLIVPEIETVFILTPRTGSGTLYRTARERYPKTILLYRHMEADGVPQGYDRWRRVGFVRHPVARLWSLYNFMKGWSRGEATAGGGKHMSFSDERARVQKQVSVPFEDWLIHNDQPWTTANCLSGSGATWPILARRDPSPENKRSQFSYLRPDLGTVIHKFENLSDALAEYGLRPDKVHNKGTSDAVPPLSIDAANHIASFCGWDLDQNCKCV